MLQLERTLPSEYHKFTIHFPDKDVVRIRFPESLAPSYGAVFNLEDEFYEVHGVIYQVDPHTEEYRIHLFVHVMDVKDKKYLLDGPERNGSERLPIEDEVERLREILEALKEQEEATREDLEEKWQGVEEGDAERINPKED